MAWVASVKRRRISALKGFSRTIVRNSSSEVEAHRVDHPHQMLERAGRMVERRQIHRHDDARDQVGEPLHIGHLPIVLGRGRPHDLEPEGALEKAGDEPRPPAATGADGDPQAGDAVPPALRAEQRVRAHDVDLGRQQHLEQP